MTREESENLLDELIDKHGTMEDYVRRDDYILTVELLDRRLCYCGGELRETWRKEMR